MSLIRKFLHRTSSSRELSIDHPLSGQWEQDGYVTLPNAVDLDLIDRLDTEISRFRSVCGETKDEFGFGQRIGLFHCRSALSLEVALNAEAQNFLKWAFQDDPVLYSSLTFETGTEQPAHQDAIFFHTAPQRCMAGVWIALEDVHPDAGPLFYISGSHNWGLARGEDVHRIYPKIGHAIESGRKNGSSTEQMNSLAVEASQLWHNLLHENIARRNAEKTPVIIKKGTVLIWHGLLVHGGLPRINRELSRRSMVVHYIGKNSLMWDMNAFFLLKNNEFHHGNAMMLKIAKHRQGEYVIHEKPVIY